MYVTRTFTYTRAKISKIECFDNDNIKSIELEDIVIIGKGSRNKIKNY